MIISMLHWLLTILFQFLFYIVRIEKQVDYTDFFLHQFSVYFNPF